MDSQIENLYKFIVLLPKKQSEFGVIAKNELKLLCLLCKAKDNLFHELFVQYRMDKHGNYCNYNRYYNFQNLRNYVTKEIDNYYLTIYYYLYKFEAGKKKKINKQTTMAKLAKE